MLQAVNPPEIINCIFHTVAALKNQLNGTGQLNQDDNNRVPFMLLDKNQNSFSFKWEYSVASTEQFLSFITSLKEKTERTERKPAQTPFFHPFELIPIYKSHGKLP